MRPSPLAARGNLRSHVHLPWAEALLPPLFLLCSSLDLGLPLWIGGVPPLFPESYPISTRGITACVRRLKVNDLPTSLERPVYQLNSETGCGQVGVRYPRMCYLVKLEICILVLWCYRLTWLCCGRVILTYLCVLLAEWFMSDGFLWIRRVPSVLGRIQVCVPFVTGRAEV